MDRSVSISCRLLVLALLAPSPVSAAVINVSGTAPYELSLDDGPTFHTAEGVVSGEGVIAGPGSILLLLWNEQLGTDPAVPYYALSFDGLAVSRVHPTNPFHTRSQTPDRFNGPNEAIACEVL